MKKNQHYIKHPFRILGNALSFMTEIACINFSKYIIGSDLPLLCACSLSSIVCVGHIIIYTLN